MADRNPTVVVTSDETLLDIVERVRAAASGGHTVHLVVPIDSSLLLTAGEFRRLKEAVDQDRLPVVMRTADPLRLQLADRLGVPVQALPRPKATAAVVAPVLPTRGVSGSPIEPDATVAVEEAPLLAPEPRPDPDSLWPSQHQHQHANGSTTVDAEDIEDAPEESAREPANPPRRWLPVAAALVLLVAGAVLAIQYVLPQAVVTIVPRSEPVAAAIAFDVTTDGSPLDEAAAFTLTSQQRTIDVVWAGSVPTTGVRIEPDETAAGPIELRNAAAEPVEVAAGTIVTTETGVEFAFSEAVTVPAVDAATGEPGAATGSVQAVQPGSGGNVGTGEIGGRLPNGVYYSNRMEPTGGGTDKEFPIVSQEDLDALLAAAREDAPKLAADTLAQEGANIVPASVEVTAQQDSFDHQAGEEAESISLETTLKVAATTYDAEATHERLAEVLVASLNDEAPQGFAVNPDAIDSDEPVVTEESERGVRFEVAARADAEAVLDDAERGALAAELAGTSPEEAAQILARSPGIGEFSVDYHPGWLQAKMPNNAGRIQFEIAP